jgi:hypothetical protein
VAAAGFVAGFASASYVVGLDRIVTARFQGQRFRVPSRVFSAPAILYPGLNWRLIDLEGTLQRLGYRETSGTRELDPGQYFWGSRRIRMHLRAFEHPSRPEPARDVVLRLRGDAIEEIRALPSGREIGAVLLEPEQLGAFYGVAREQRELVRLDEVPEHLVGAVLAVEDQRFETHPGIDLKRIAGALLANLRAGSIRQGGSTLTQQLVKNFFLTPERTLRRKAQEAVMALLVELRYDKREILQAYLNEIYLGQRGATAVHGVGEAARLYFGKRCRDLSVAESALLAAIIQSPNGISPYRDPARESGAGSDGRPGPDRRRGVYARARRAATARLGHSRSRRRPLLPGSAPPPALGGLRRGSPHVRGAAHLLHPRWQAAALGGDLPPGGDRPAGEALPAAALRRSVAFPPGLPDRAAAADRGAARAGGG